jgi:hypothetical protein
MFTLIAGSEKEHRLLVGGRDIKVTTLVSWGYDDIPYDGDDEDGSIADALETGRLTNVIIKVTAIWQGVEGDDYLGGCLIKNDKDLLEVMEYHGMREQAIAALKDQILININIYKDFTKE